MDLQRTPYHTIPQHKKPKNRLPLLTELKTLVKEKTIQTHKYNGHFLFILIVHYSLCAFQLSIECNSLKMCTVCINKNACQSVVMFQSFKGACHSNSLQVDNFRTTLLFPIILIILRSS